MGDVVRLFGPALLAERGEAVTPAQRAALAVLGRCHTAALGGHVYRCDACATEHVAFNGCGSRLCPSCLGLRSAKWLQDRAAQLLPVPYFHVVFTVPEQIAALALGNKKSVYGILFQAASQTLQEIAADPKHLGAKLGFLSILHTWTQKLQHHPHLHCVVPGGGLCADGDSWVSCREGFFLPVRVLSSLFRGKLLALLDRAARRGELRFGGATAALASARAWQDFLHRMRRKAWVVYAKPPFGSPERVLKYLARYTHRGAISNRRILSLSDAQVTFRYRDRKRDNTLRTMTLSGVEFLRRFLLHLLPKGFVRIRYFGFLANRSRKAKLAHIRGLLGAPDLVIEVPAAPEQDSDAEPTTQVIGQGRLCPSCGVGHLQWAGQLTPATSRSPPLLPRPPPGTT